MEFDAIIVGTGMGGGALGYRLVQAGLKVLFLEKGSAPENKERRFSGDYAERFIGEMSRTEVFERTGRSTLKVDNWMPVLGSGAGGSTDVYGAVLLPFQPEDLKTWPDCSYDDLLPYYRECDRLFRPIGSQDPLLPDRILGGPRELSAAAQEIAEFLKSKGLHPYSSPVGFENQTECQQCFGFFCPRNCKKTSWNVLVEPCLNGGQAKVLFSTCVQEILLRENKVIGLVCKTAEGLKRYSAKNYFLAAGALATPSIMLNSKSALFPQGVGNQEDLVGRNLMRHLIDFYYVKTASSASARGHLIELAASDFCQKEYRWGCLNVVAGLMSPDLMANEVVERWKNQSRISFPTKFLNPLITSYLLHQSKNRVLVNCIFEDSAEASNRILPHSTVDKIFIDYRISDADRRRLKESRRHIKHLLRPLSVRMVKVAEDSSFLAHVCGTCRMSSNAKTGVVDPQGKVFGIKNLYIADTSTFPTSGSANPSMTTAALSLKIADHFLRTRWKI